MNLYDSSIIWVGFVLASFSVVGNDVIQTLGTFLTSNERRYPWYVLFAFVASILVLVLGYGWLFEDVAYGRLNQITPSVPGYLQWYYLLPPLTLLFITRLGIPVSTTFMILTIFSLEAYTGNSEELLLSISDPSSILGRMVIKSISGYVLAFFLSLSIYLSMAHISHYFIKTHDQPIKNLKTWTVLQWLSTGFLWSQWLVQDLANIYIYLMGPYKHIGLGQFLISLLIILLLLAYLFYVKGGSVQKIVKSKTNTTDIRSATIIDFIYALILLSFKEDLLGIWGGKIPMSTTWVFVGLLAGRELGIFLRLHKYISKTRMKNLFFDFIKISLGLVISVFLVLVIKIVTQ
jgi:hypothetical protein